MSRLCSHDSQEREKYLEEWTNELRKKAVGGRPSTGRQGEDEDGARRLRLPRAPGMGEGMGAANLPAASNSLLNCDLGFGVVC